MLVVADTLKIILLTPAYHFLFLEYFFFASLFHIHHFIQSREF